MINVNFDIENKEKTLRWLDRVREGLEDARPLWKALTPKITDFIDYEFDPKKDAHKKWAVLSGRHLAYKKRKGYNPGIGNMKGKLKKGAGMNAIKKYKEKSLLWKLNHAKVKSKRGYEYAWVFHKGNPKTNQPARPIYRFTCLRINSFVRRDVKKGIGLTYNWLKKAIKEANKK